MEAINNINKKLEEQNKKLAHIQINIDKLSFAPTKNNVNTNTQIQSIIYIVIGLFIHSFFSWLLTRK